MKKLLLALFVAFGFLLLGNKAFAQTIAYNTSPFTFTVGVAVNLIPTASGTVTAATLRAGGGRSTTLPNGLTLNANGTITGTPTTVTATANFEVTATIRFQGNANSNAFTIAVVAAPVTVAATSLNTATNPATPTAGLTANPISATATGLPVYGLQLAASATGTTTNLTALNFTSSTTGLTTNNLFIANAYLYSNTTNTYATGTKTLLQTITGVGATNTLNFTGLSKSIAAGSTTYYFVVVDYTTPVTTTATWQLNYTSSTGVTSTGTPVGYKYNFSALTITAASIGSPGIGTVGLITSTVNTAQTKGAIYGLSLTPSGSGPAQTITSLSFTATSTQNDNYFYTTAYLYTSSSPVFPGGSPIASVATGANKTITFTGFSNTVSGTTPIYYFIAMDYPAPGVAATATQTFALNSIGGPAFTGAATGNTYSFQTVPVLTATDLTGASLTSSTIYQGQTNIAVAGVSFVMNASTTTLSQLVFTISPSDATAFNYFANPPTLVTCPTSTYSSATATTVTTAGNSFTGTTFTFNLSPAATVNTTTTYYFLVLNYSVTGGSTPQVFTFNPTSYTTALGTVTPAYTANTYTCASVVAHTYDWTGAVGTAWANPQNWDIAGVQQTTLYPGSAITGDVADIGVNINYTTNQPVVTTTLPYNVGSINLGANNGTAITVTVTGVTLTVTGAITQNHNSANGGLNTTVAGTGAISCGSFKVGDNTAPPSPSGDLIFGGVWPTMNSTSVTSTINTLTINGNLTMNSTSSAIGSYTVFGIGPFKNYCVNNPLFNLSTGTVTVNNIVTSNSNDINNYNGGDLLYISNSVTYEQQGGNTNTLNLLGNTPITFVTGTVIDFAAGSAGANSYVNYEATSGTQTVYNSTDGINTTPSAYANLTLSAASAKTVDGGTLSVGQNLSSSGGAVNLNTNNPTVTVSGSWTNSTTTTQGTGNITISGAVTNNSGGTLALGSANFYVGGNYTNNVGGVYSQSTGTTYFNGGSQALVDNSTTGTTFNKVTFNGSGTSTMSAGTNNVNFAVSSSGILTMTSPAKLVAGSSSVAYLTLNSDATGCAAVAPITYAAPISGYVNVQRYITGTRGYRLLSSPVYSGTDGNGNNVYGLSYLANNLYLTGSGAGFPHSGNPTLYLYDEGFVPQYTTFLNSNFIGVATLPSGTTPAYSLNTNTPGLNSTYTIPAGNAYYCFFRGNLSQGTPSLTTPGLLLSETPATVTATGILNQGQVTFKDWYTPTSSYLGGSSQNYNLIGNPYASAIDLSTIPTATATSGIYITPTTGGTYVSPYIYELNPVTGNYGQYVAYGPLAGYTQNGGSQYVASGQGFFVQAFGSTCQLVFNESAKATSANANAPGLMVTQRSFAAVNPASVNSLLKLKMSKDSVQFEESLLTFGAGYKSGFVNTEDAPYRVGSGKVGLSSTSSDNVQLAINSMPFQNSQIIPLNVSAVSDGLYTINMAQTVPLPPIYDLWLKDAFKKDSLDIKNNPTYSFDILHADTNTYGSHRFSLIIRQNPALMVHLLNFGATKVATGDQVIWTTENEQNYTNFTVERSTDGGSTFNVLGGFAASGIGSYSLMDKAPVLGANAYRLKMSDLNGAVTYSNVVTIMYGNTGNQVATNGFILYPNPTAGPMNLKMNQINAGQAYTIQIVNNLGTVIKTVTSNQPNWQTDVSSLVPGTYFVEVKNNSTNALVGKSGFVKL